MIDFDRILLAALEMLRKQEAEPPFRMAINIYDINDKLSFTKFLGLGLFHSAFEFLNKEIAYGGHQYKGTGIYVNAPFRVPAPAKFHKQLQLGVINLSINEICNIIAELSIKYQGRQYQLTTHNCNDFTQELVFRLTGEDILPSFVNRISRVAVKFGYTGPPGLDPVSQLIAAGYEQEPTPLNPTPMNELNTVAASIPRESQK